MKGDYHKVTTFSDNRGLIAVISNPADYPTEDYRTKLFDHLEQKGMKIRESVRKWLHVHHRDHDRSNNKLNNLAPLHRLNHKAKHPEISFNWK